MLKESQNACVGLGLEIRPLSRGAINRREHCSKVITLEKVEPEQLSNLSKVLQQQMKSHRVPRKWGRRLGMDGFTIIPIVKTILIRSPCIYLITSEDTRKRDSFREFSTRSF